MVKAIASLKNLLYLCKAFQERNSAKNEKSTIIQILVFGMFETLKNIKKILIIVDIQNKSSNFVKRFRNETNGFYKAF